MNLDLPFEELVSGELDELLEALDAAVDASFLGEVKEALERAAAPAPEAPAAA